MEGCVFHKIPMSATIYRRLKDVGGGPNLHNVMALPGIFGVVVQMTQRYYGEAKNLLMAALSSEYQHPKVAIAVDADVDIFNHAELLWALTTRVNPQQDVVIIPGTHNHAMDASLPELGAPGTPLWQRLGLQDADRRHHPAARRRRGARGVRAHPAAQSATAAGGLRRGGIDGHRELAVVAVLRLQADPVGGR